MLIKINAGTDEERIIGEALPDSLLFKKKVKKSKHLYKKTDSWGIDAAYFTDVLLSNEYTIMVEDRDEASLYTISAADFKLHSHYYHFLNPQDHHPQIFCSRRFWSRQPLNP